VFAVFSTLLVTSSKRTSEDNREKPPVKIHFCTVGARHHYSHWDDLLVQLSLKTDSKVAMCCCMTDL
jgi:predicted nucleic acid-binding protein